MKKIFFLIAAFISEIAMAAPQFIDGMYVNTFGNDANPAVIFVHGGPGYNSHDFEVTTAETLSRRGFFVVVYDQRGSGRSSKASLSEFNYSQYSSDLKKVIDTLRVKNPVIIGHSHGGPISVQFNRNYPNIAKAIVLVGAPVQLKPLVHNILNHCTENFERMGQPSKIEGLTFLYYKLFVDVPSDKTEKAGLIAGAFAQGIDCGLYKVSNPTQEQKDLAKKLGQSPISTPLQSGFDAVLGFTQNEDYTSLDVSDEVFNNKAKIFGIYGDEDGLFSRLDLAYIKNLVAEPGRTKFVEIKGASHALYMHKQSEFLNLFDHFLNSL